jgi:hypothetical protein
MTDPITTTMPDKFVEGLEGAHQRAAAWALNNAIQLACIAYRETFVRAFAACYSELIEDELESAP